MPPGSGRSSDRVACRRRRRRGAHEVRLWVWVLLGPVSRCCRVGGHESVCTERGRILLDKRLSQPSLDVQEKLGAVCRNKVFPRAQRQTATIRKRGYFVQTPSTQEKSTHCSGCVHGSPWGLTQRFVTHRPLMHSTLEAQNAPVAVWHAPAPLQALFPAHGGSTLVSANSAGKGEQFPGAMLQETHTSSQGVLQHVPSAQMPLLHSSSVLHADPRQRLQAPPPPQSTPDSYPFWMPSSQREQTWSLQWP